MAFHPEGLINGHPRETAPVSAFRPMIASDIPWALDLADELYGGGIDKNALGHWARQVLVHPQYLAIRSSSAVVVAAAVPPAFDLSVPDARALYFYGRDIWQVLRLLRLAAMWAKMKGARHFRLEDATGRDISGVAKRLRAYQDPIPSFVMEL